MNRIQHNINTCFILTFGFDSSILARLIGKYGLRDEDIFILVKSKVPHIKADIAVSDAKNLISKLNNNVKVETLNLDERELENNVLTLVKVISRYKDMRIIIDISGGPRLLGMSLYIAAGIMKIKNVLIRLETTSEDAYIGTLSLQPCVRLTPRQIQILKLLPAKPSQVAKALKISRSTALRHLQKLERKGLVIKNDQSMYGRTPLTSAVIWLASQEINSS